jgi:hypothetical protein
MFYAKSKWNEYYLEDILEVTGRGITHEKAIGTLGGYVCEIPIGQTIDNDGDDITGYQDGQVIEVYDNKEMKGEPVAIYEVKISIHRIK